MANIKEDVQNNTFVQGLVTEASPLAHPKNASSDEINFKLNRDGSRDRRLGIDFEDGFVLNSTGYTAEQLSVATRSFYRWSNPSGARNVDIGVIQIGGYIYFANLLAESPSADLLNGGVPILTTADYTAVFEYAVLNNSLVAISTALDNPYLVHYNATTEGITWETSPLYVRDTEGVEDNLRVDERPETLTALHAYNLKNQGWVDSISTTCGEGISPVDCTFQTFQVYPSNSDHWSIGRVEDLTDANVKKYNPEIAKRNLVNGGYAPRGHYIIKAFDRGSSRTYASGISGLPADRELGRVKTVAAYAGRAWYSGITSKIVDGDSRSPSAAGLVFFSQILQTSINLVNCFTEADPTNIDFNEVVDSDGGVINIPEVNNIVKLLPIKDSLFVFAENGVWEISGGQNGFTATSFKVGKIASIGVHSPRSIVEVNGVIFFWAIDGIYSLTQNDNGTYTSTNVTLDRIQKLYNTLPASARRTAKGYYDAANNKLRWLYYSEEAEYTGTPATIPPDQTGGGENVPFDLQALLDAGVTNILAGVGSDYRLNVDADNAFVAFQHKDAVYNGTADPGGLRPALGISSAGIAMGYNDAGGTWHNSVAISATGDATFAGTVAANSIIANEAYLGSISGYTIAEAIVILDNSLATFNLQGALDAGVGYILAGVGGDYEMIVDDAGGFAAFKHKDAVYEGTSTPGAGQTALGISSNGIAMGFNDPITGAWTNAVAITSTGDASFLGTVSAGSVIANTVTVSGSGQSLQDMIDDIATFSGGAFNLQAALDAGVTNILAGTGADYRMTVDTSGAFVAFHHKDAVYNGSAGAGAIRPAIGLSAAGIGMGYNDATGAWVNAVALDATGNATFKGTISANSIIANTATINGVSVGTIQTDSSAAAIHAALTGNPHNVSLTQIAGDLDDITDGGTYFKTTATQVTGAGRAANALDSSSDYIRSLQSTKIVVSGTNPTTGWVGDSSGIRLYQSGVLKVNLPVSGAPSFTGDITGGANINISGSAQFAGTTLISGNNYCVSVNASTGTPNGLYTRATSGNAVSAAASANGGIGVLASASHSGAVAIAASHSAGGNALTVSGKMVVVGDSTFTGNTNTTGQVQCANFRINQSPSTGGATATFTSTNKPGSSSANQWLAIAVSGGAVRYIPVWT